MVLLPNRPIGHAQESQEQRLQLLQFINWLLPVAFGFSLFHFVVLFVLGDLANGIGGFVVFAYGCVALWARRLVRQGKTTQSVTTLCVGLLVMIPGHVLALPELYPALAVAPLLVVAIALPYLPPAILRSLSIACLLVTIAVPVLGRWVRLLPPAPAMFIEVLSVVSVPAAIGMVTLLLWQFHQRLHHTLDEMRAANTELVGARESLEATLAEQSAMLAQVQALSHEQAQLLSENALQRAAIRELSVPILPVSGSTLVIPLVGVFDTPRLLHMQERTLERISETGARRLVIDVTGVPIVDTLVAQGLISIVQMARLLGATVTLVGIRPEVAQTLVQLGVQIGDVQTFRDLQAALAQPSPIRQSAG